MSYLTVTIRDMFQAHILDVHLPNILIGIGASIEIPLMTTLGRRIGLSHPQIADFVTLSSLCRTLLDIPYGVVVEYVGVRNVMMSTLLLNAAASVLGLFIVDKWTLFIFCVLSGVSLGGFFLSRHIFVAGISSKKYRGMLMSFLSGLLRWAHVIGPAVAGLIASYTGDVRDAFYVAAATALLAFTTLFISSRSESYQERCARTCSSHTSLSRPLSPHMSDTDEHQHQNELPFEDPQPRTHEEVPVVCTPLRRDTLQRHMKAEEIGGEEISFPCIRRGANSVTTAMSANTQTTVQSVHPSMAAGEEHYFQLSSVWYTFVDNWSIIWRLGLFVVFFGSLRANRKLMVILASMRLNLNDSDVNYMLSFGFAFDALLFPLGGIIMDLMGRRFAILPVTLGLSCVFALLPFCNSDVTLFAVAAAFGIVDALGCGLVMTLTADRAPKVYAAPFFGILRTLADTGHVVGARSVAFLLSRYDFRICCWFLAVQGVLTALWGVFGIPKDETPMETPRMESIKNHGREKQQQQPLLVGSEDPRVGYVKYGTA